MTIKIYNTANLYRKVPLKNGLYAIIDEDDYKFISYFRWSIRECPHTTYAFCNIRDQDMKWTTCSMHRFIMSSPKGLIIDHINHDGLDNRKDNLRICSAAENVRNSRGKRIRKHKYKGIRWNKGSNKWESKIVFNRKEIYLGGFDSPELAAKAYNSGATKYHGEFACLNIIEE